METPWEAQTLSTKSKSVMAHYEFACDNLFPRNPLFIGHGQKFPRAQNVLLWDGGALPLLPLCRLAEWHTWDAGPSISAALLVHTTAGIPPSKPLLKAKRQS